MSKKEAMRRTDYAMKLYASAVFAYLFFIMVLPANSQAVHDYNLSTLEYRVLYFAIALPSVVVWFAAFFSYAKLQEYADSIRKTSEASAFERLAIGCKWLAWGLPAAALAAITLNTIADQWIGFQSAAIILANYIALGFALVALSIIGGASRELVNRARIRLDTIGAPSVMLLFVTGGVLYCYLTFRHFDSNDLTSADNPYHLPIWLMLITVIIPYLYAWFVGLLAAYEIMAFRRQVRGVLYKQALHLLVSGLIVVIAGSIGLQYVSSVAPSLGHLTLDYRLLLLILLILVDGIGFVLIALGALRLRKIEEV